MMARSDGIARRVAGLLFASFFLVFLGPAVVQVYLKNLIGTEDAAQSATIILAILYFSFMFWRLFIVRTQRAIGDKLSVVLGLAGYLVLPVALVVTTNFWVLAAGAAVWGWAAGALWQTGPLWLYDNTNPRRRGLWAGALYAALFLGLWCGTLIVAVAAKAGRTDVMLWLLILPGVFAVVLAMMLPARASKAEPLSLSGIRAMVFDKGVVLIGLLLLTSAGTYGLLLGAFRNRIDSIYGAGTVGQVVSNFFAARLLVSIAGGHFSDFIARRTVIAVVFGAGALALAAAGIHGGVAALCVAAAALGIVGGTVPVSATAYAADWFAPEKRALALGAAFFWQDAGTAISLLAGQYLASFTRNVSVPMLAFAGLFLASAAMSLLLPDARSARPPEGPRDGN